VNVLNDIKRLVESSLSVKMRPIHFKILLLLLFNIIIEVFNATFKTLLNS